jgi:hypothetical protein
MPRGNGKKKSEDEERGNPVSLAPVPFEEAVGDLLKVKKPTTTAKKKTQKGKRTT